jgi:hypothetical protein
MLETLGFDLLYILLALTSLLVISWASDAYKHAYSTHRALPVNFRFDTATMPRSGRANFESVVDLMRRNFDPTLCRRSTDSTARNRRPEFESVNDLFRVDTTHAA